VDFTIELQGSDPVERIFSGGGNSTGGFDEQTMPYCELQEAEDLSGDGASTLMLLYQQLHTRWFEPLGYGSVREQFVSNLSQKISGQPLTYRDMKTALGPL